MSKALWMVPTYRSLEGAATLGVYAQHFADFNHNDDVDLLLSDDSDQHIHAVTRSLSQAKKAYGLSIYYLGSEQKEKIRLAISEKCKFDDQQSRWLTNVTRPSYGGNRNAGLLALAILNGAHSYRFLMSSDDDMKPGGYTQSDDYISRNGHVLEARFVPKRKITGYKYTKSDIFQAFNETLGQGYEEILRNNHLYKYGQTAKDVLVSNKFNYATDLVMPSTVTHIVVDKSCDKIGGGIVQIAHTFRSGHEDGDASTLIAQALTNGTSISGGFLSDKDLLIQDIRPYVVEENWMHDCGVAGYTTEFSLKNPFLPTTLRCEDFGHRLKIEQDGDTLGARVNAIQHHNPSTTNRPGLVHQFFVEEVSFIFKKILTEAGYPTRKIPQIRPEISDDIIGQMLDRARQLKKMAEKSTSPDAAMIQNQIDDVFFSEGINIHHKVCTELDKAWQSTVAMEQIWPTVIDASQTHAQELTALIQKIR